MFGKNQDRQDRNENKDFQENSLENNENSGKREEKFSYNPDRIVKVISKQLLDSKIIVVYKKIKMPKGIMREVFNIYTFVHNLEKNQGECLMPERDAILFWKDRVEAVGIKDDVKLFTEDEEFEYDYKESKNLYKLEIEGLENSEQRE
jgi:hypothetical protein